MTTATTEGQRALSNAVAEEIRAMMARRRMSGRELALALGVSPAWVSYRLVGKQPIDLNDLQQIAAALGVKIVQLLPEGVRNGQTPYSASLPDRPRDTRPANRRNGPSGGPGRASSREDTRRPVRRRSGPSMAPLPRVA